MLRKGAGSESELRCSRHDEDFKKVVWEEAKRGEELSKVESKSLAKQAPDVPIGTGNACLRPAPFETFNRERYCNTKHSIYSQTLLGKQLRKSLAGI